MRLIDNIRDAEKRSLSSVRRKVERAREEWNDVERRIRQRMRLYPQKLRAKMGARPASEAEAQELESYPIDGSAENSKREPIISVNGRDVDEQELTKRAG